MSIAFVLALITATLNSATALAHFAVARAPGWRSARAFAFIAATAACYSVGNLVFCQSGLPEGLYFAAARWNYFFAHLHTLAWYPFAFGGPDARLRAMPRPIRWLAGAGLAIAVLFAATGASVQPAIHMVDVAWAHVVYRYALTTPLGDAYGYLVFAQLLVPVVAFVVRLARGAREHATLVAGLVVFVACAILELLVANGDLVWISPVDIGFLAVVAPTSLRVLRRFISDARRLRVLTSRLEGEVRDRTQERDRAQTALVDAERLAALGRLAAGVGHEINNPLTYLQLSLERVEHHLHTSGAPEDVRGAAADVRDGAWRIQKVAEGLKTYSRRQEDERTALDPGELVRSALKVAGPQVRYAARVETDLAQTPPVLGDEPRLVQAMVNLVVNAAQALREHPAGGRIVVRSRALDDGAVALEVEDNGPGIPADLLAHVSEPYFTTRGSRGGLGLGLFVTRGIVDAHGGRLEMGSGAGGGTLARIVLPAVPQDAPGASRQADLPASTIAPADVVGTPRLRGRLLLVDDEPLVLQLLASALERRWDVTCVPSGDMALALLGREQFDGVVCDLMMPGISGMELADWLETRDPAARRRMVFLTGGAVTCEAETFLGRSDVVHMMKPVRVAELDALLREQCPPAGPRRGLC